MLYGFVLDIIANFIYMKAKPKPFKLTAPKAFVPLEIDEQVAVFDWLKWCKLPGADMAYSTLNGVKLPIGYAVKLSKAGLKRGPLDINLDVARGGKFGFRGELKRIKGGVVSIEQEAWIERLQDEGYFVVVKSGAQEMIASITWYLKQPRTVVIPFAPHDEELRK